MKKYTEEDLVSFGSYLLSQQRMELIKSHPEFIDVPELDLPRHDQVSDADILNWKQLRDNISSQ